MKLFKKLVVVVAMAAVCFTMTAPVSAQAAACTHDNTTRVYLYNITDSYDHTYDYWADIDNDGRSEHIYDTCHVEVRQYSNRYVCTNCRWLVFSTPGETLVVHSEYNCTQNDGSVG